MPEEQQKPVESNQTPVTPAAGHPNGGKPAETGNVFTKLFGISSQTQNQPPSGGSPGAFGPPPKPPSIASLLGPKPLFSKQTIAEEERKMTRLAKAVFWVAVLLAVSVYGFFSIQLNPGFTLFSEQLGPSVAIRFERSNGELQKLQTDRNLVRYRTARVMLDEASALIDSWRREKSVIASSSSSPIEKQKAEEQAKLVSDQIKQKLKEVQIILQQPLGIDTFSPTPVTVEEREVKYESLLRDSLARESSVEGGGNAAQVMQLIDNKELRTLLTSHDVGTLSDEDFEALLARIREASVDERSLIEKLRSRRVNWNEVISDINSVTRKADLYYGQGLFKTVGGFLFSSYRFDAKSRRVGLTGVTKTSDSKTFSFITKMLDATEKSPKFKDVDFRTFSKNRDENGDYSAAISLDFTIQEGPDPRDE